VPALQLRDEVQLRPQLRVQRAEGQLKPDQAPSGATAPRADRSKDMAMRIPLLISITYLLVQPAPPAATSVLAAPASATAAAAFIAPAGSSAPPGSHVGDSAAHLAAREIESALAEMGGRHGPGTIRLSVLTMEYDVRGDAK